MSVTLLVFFEDPFWVGIVERREGGRLRAARVVFGAEPSDREVYAWVLESFDGLRFSRRLRTACAARWRKTPSAGSARP